MKQQKKMIFNLIAIILVILIILLIIRRILIITQPEENHVGADGYAGDDQEEIIIDSAIKRVTERNNFYTILSCIEDYFATNKKDFSSFRLKKVYQSQELRNTTYFAYGQLGTKDFYITIRLNYTDMKYWAIENDYIDFENIKVEDVSGLKEYNIFKFQHPSDSVVAKDYLRDYIETALSRPESAYSLIDEQYKKRKFTNLEEYKRYLEENKKQMQESVFETYTKKEYDGFTQYICVDNFNNSFVINETGILDYTIMLDNYTVNVGDY